MSHNEASDQRRGGRGTVEARKRRRMRPTLMALEDRRLLSTIVVNNPTDTPVAGQIDLRQAIAQANTNGGTETIAFDKTVFKTPQTITLSGTPARAERHDRDGDDHGPEGGRDGQRRRARAGCSRSTRCHRVDLGTDDHRRQRPPATAAACTTTGHATLTNCTVSGNSAITVGGGLFNNGGTITLTNCTVSGNSAASTAAAWSTIAARPR